MALESTPNQAFLCNDGADDFAALDSMAFTGTQSQFGMKTVTPSVSGSSGGSFGGSGHDYGRVGDGREGGFAGVSESLFDRIRARTAEQQKQTMASQSSQSQASSVSSQPQPQPQPPQTMMQPPQPAQEAAQSSSQQSGFAPQQPSGNPTMEYEKDLIGMDGGSNAFAGAPAPNNVQNNYAANNGNNETTYSFSASAGENFTQPAIQVPQYGASRDDPYYVAANNQQHHPSSIQDKASMALAQTGQAVKSLFGAGLSGAQTVGGMARNKLGGGGGQAGGGGERSYNNNFLLRDEEEGENNMGNNNMGMGNDAMNNATAMGQPPPPVAAAVASGAETGGQAYSMLSYGKTFCEDLVGFVRQLPPWGKGIVAVALLWVLYVIFG